MTNCKEFVLDDIMAITAIPIQDYALGTLEWQVTPTIPVSQFYPNLANAITIGMRPATTGGTLIPIIRLTGKVSDDTNDDTAGRLHTVTANCQVDERDFSVWEHLLALERTPSHLIVTFRDNTRAFVAATEDSYVFKTERDGAKVSVSFRIHNYMGAQVLV